MNREVLLEEPNCRLIFRASVKNDRKGLPAAGLPYRPHSRHSHVVPGGEVHGGEGGAGVSQYAAFTGKGGGEEKGEKDSLEAQQDGSGCWPGLQSKEQNPARTVLVHYLGCN